ncbi:unnamed protein product [Allacma fusca]|uniref:Uncharacterized protein n=1 Tax=Allacma fusca TaxID=39272 RepID=A0A8J2P1M9_9HEXA|nr:unnamed protein product [Allacma fusca]
MKASAIGSLVVVVGFCVVSALGNPAVQSEKVNTARAWKDGILPVTSTNLTKSIIDSTLSVLGVFAFTMAFVIIPVLALLYTSGLSWQRSSSRSLKSDSQKAHVRLARGILDSDRCIERIVCEVSKGARNSRAERWADAVFSNIPKEGKFMSRISNAYRGRNVGSDCETYTCEPVGFIVRLFIYATDWNTVLKG